jgi:hypothetical protein
MQEDQVSSGVLSLTDIVNKNLSDGDNWSKIYEEISKLDFTDDVIFNFTKTALKDIYSLCLVGMYSKDTGAKTYIFEVGDKNHQIFLLNDQGKTISRLN